MHSIPQVQDQWNSENLLFASWNLYVIIFVTEHVIIKKRFMKRSQEQPKAAYKGWGKKRLNLLSTSDRCPWTPECCFLWKRNLLFVPGFLILYSSSLYILLFFFTSAHMSHVHCFLLQNLFTSETSFSLIRAL